MLTETGVKWGVQQGNQMCSLKASSLVKGLARGVQDSRYTRLFQLHFSLLSHTDPSAQRPCVAGAPPLGSAGPRPSPEKGWFKASSPILGVR